MKSVKCDTVSFWCGKDCNHLLALDINILVHCNRIFGSWFEIKFLKLIVISTSTYLTKVYVILKF